MQPTRQNIIDFKEKGYFRVPEIFSKKDVQELKDEALRIMEEALKQGDSSRVDATRKDTDRAASGIEKFRKINGFEKQSTLAWNRFICNPKLIALQTR